MSTNSARDNVWMMPHTLEDSYDTLCHKMDGFMKAQRLLADFLKEACAHVDEPQVLELGCGTGITTNAVLSRLPRAKVVALDPSDHMIARVRRRLSKNDEKRVTIFPSDALAFCESRDQQQKWDAAYAAFTLHNLDVVVQEATARAVANVLKPKGCFILADYGIREGADRISAFSAHIEELFTILGPARHLAALRNWTVHSLEDMRETRVQDQMKMRDILKDAGFTEIFCQFTGSLEAVYHARK